MSTTIELVFCACQGCKVEEGRCDYCDHDVFDDPDDYDIYEDPPLYPAGTLAAMSLEELEREYTRQCHRQGSLGDAERIDERAVEETEMRCRLIEAEIKKRKVAV